ncbi:Fabp5p [Mactra antiquata]
MAFLGVWSTKKNENLEDCMKELGLPSYFLKLAKDIGLQLEISKDGDGYTVKHVASVVVSDQHFKLGQDFETNNWLGEKIKGAVTMEGNSMIADTTEGTVKSKTKLQTSDNKLHQLREFATGTKTSEIIYVKA